MRDILDPANFWVGTSDGAQVFVNKRPVAIHDTLVVGINSGPVTVNVLANDYDPEGSALTLVLAYAALGTAVAEADNTVTYTPPTDISGFDSVVYEIADDLDQRRTGQVNITITDIGFALAVTVEADNTLSVTADDGAITVTVTQPGSFAGSYGFNTTDLASGPVSLAKPGITGDLATGNTLTAVAGLWAYDDGSAAPARSYQWRRGGADIAGATGAAYSVQSADLGPGVTVVETASNFTGTRSAESDALSGSGAFAPTDDTQLIGWWDGADTGTITTISGGEVTEWADKSTGLPLEQTSPVRRPVSGTRTQNGLNLIDFPGDRFLQRSETLPASGNLAFHGVFVIDSTSNAFEALFAVNATSDFQLDANNAAQFDGRLNATGIGAPLNLSNGPFSGTFALSIIFDLTGSGTAEVFVSDQSCGTTSYTTAIDSSSVLHLMTNRSQNAFVDGAVGEFILTENIANRADYHAYLATKWGVT